MRRGGWLCSSKLILMDNLSVVLYCIVLFVCRMIMSEGNFVIAASRVQQGSAT